MILKKGYVSSIFLKYLYHFIWPFFFTGIYFECSASLSFLHSGWIISLFQFFSLVPSCFEFHWPIWKDCNWSCSSLTVASSLKNLGIFIFFIYFFFPKDWVSLWHRTNMMNTGAVMYTFFKTENYKISFFPSLIWIPVSNLRTLVTMITEKQVFHYFRVLKV